MSVVTLAGLAGAAPGRVRGPLRARVCIVTAGHVATSPRLLKAADTLREAGYRVRVISTRTMAWADQADAEIRLARARCWEWTPVDYRRSASAVCYLRSRLRFRASGILARALGAARCPLPVAIRAYSRAHTELLRAALAEPVDLYY